MIASPAFRAGLAISYLIILQNAALFPPQRMDVSRKVVAFFSIFIQWQSSNTVLSNRFTFSPFRSE